MMEFLDPKKRKTHRQKLFLGYGLIAVALAMMTIIVVFAAYGYDVDRKTGQVIQNGMIILNSAPESSRIHINGKDEGTTDKRLSLPTGQYQVELSRDGYRTWKHDVNLAGGAIEQLVYPFLFPTSLQTKSIQNYLATPELTTQSPDRRWLLVQRPGDGFGAFQVTDLNDNNNPTTTIVFPDGVVSTGTKHTFSAVEWSTNNNELLLKHDFDGKTEFLVLNRDDPAKSLNVTATLSERTFTDVRLRDKKADQFYLYNSADKSLYTANLRNRQYVLVASQVLSFKSYQQDTMLYVTPSADTNRVTVHLQHKGTDKELRTLAASPTYLLDAANFEGKLYVVVGSQNESKAYLYKDPLDSLDGDELPKSFRALTLEKAQYVSFSKNARFIALQAGSKFTVYDAETDRHFRYDTKLGVVDGRQALWMDGHRLTLVTNDGVSTVFDFDGTNMHSLNSAVPGSDIYFDRDYSALFVIAPNAEQKPADLTRTELRLNP